MPPRVVKKVAGPTAHIKTGPTAGRKSLKPSAMPVSSTPPKAQPEAVIKADSKPEPTVEEKIVPFQDLNELPVEAEPEKEMPLDDANNNDKESSKDSEGSDDGVKGKVLENRETDAVMHEAQDDEDKIHDQDELTENNVVMVEHSHIDEASEGAECGEERGDEGDDNSLLLCSSGWSEEHKSFQVNLNPSDLIPLSSDLNPAKFRSKSYQVKVTQNVGIEDFEVLKVVGEGEYGKVFQVQRKGTSQIFAMKVIDKKVLLRDFVDVEAETDILTKVVHPFIVQLRYSFQTEDKIYLVMDFINGGELLFHLQRKGRFSEDLARIYLAEIICAVSYLHENGIIHGDLKAHNILLDSEGHVKLIDFGLAREVGQSDGSNRKISILYDWWRVGSLLYEMLFGRDLPFVCFAVNQHLSIKFPPNLKYLSSDAQSLLKGLLQTDPSKCLGCGASGSDEIKGHNWFKSIDWNKLEARQIEPTFKPDVKGNCCTANFNFDEY